MAKIKADSDEVAKHAVYPMYKPEELVERLTRANEQLKLIDQVNSYISQTPGLKKRFESMTGESKI